VLRDLKDLREIRVSKDLSVIHLKDHRVLKVIHHKEILVEVVIKEPKEVQVTLHKEE
jgi:hypothetical protein